MAKRFFVLALLVGLVAGAQESKTPKTVAITINSTDARVQQIRSDLAQEAQDVVQRFKNVKGIIVEGETGEAADTARHKGADLLLSIEVSPRPYASVEISKAGATQNPFPTPERAQAEGSIFVKYTVQRLDGKFKASDNWIMRGETYPLGPDWDWLKAIASHAVRDAAAGGMKKLQSKKQI